MSYEIKITIFMKYLELLESFLDNGELKMNRFLHFFSKFHIRLRVTDMLISCRNVLLSDRSLEMLFMCLALNIKDMI